MIKEKRIYLSGSISSRGWEESQRHFFNLQRKLITRGHQVFNPVTCSQQSSWEEYMRVGLSSLLNNADAVFMLKGWKKSRGACLERTIAFELSIPIYYEEDIIWDSLEN